MHHKIISAAVIVAMTVLPFAAQADILPLSAAATPVVAQAASSPLACFDLTSTLKMGSAGYAVRGLQYGLMHEGFTIAPSEYGMFGTTTYAAVNGFQLKYAGTILSDGGAPTGMVGKMSRAKLNSIYGCSVPMATTMVPVATSTTPASVMLNVKDVSLDSTGVTAIVCNNSPTDVPVFPVRIRLNGVIRDFSVPGAVKAGVCDTEAIPYATWGLSYDPGVTYGVVTSLDPTGIYKTAVSTYPLVGTTTLSVPAVMGAHLSVRGISIKSNGLQGTLCNLGTADLANYPVRITINGVSKDVDVTALHTHGICQATTWTYDMFGLTPMPKDTIKATINIDPSNVIQETNEYDNSATIVGTI